MDEQLLELAANVRYPLGVYELPEPEHRLLTPREVRRIAQSGRFRFMKDTCRQVEPFVAKVNAALGTPLKLFQANLKVLPPSMDAGGCGFCGWMPMVAPELCAQVVSRRVPEDIRRRAYEKLLDFQTVMVEQGFPSAAKYLLMRRGVNIQSFSRVHKGQHFSASGAAILDQYIDQHQPFTPIVLNAV
jgi:4-hydroxy-tetrahydrodipicolinate synthase